MGTPFDLGKSQCHISRTAKNDPKSSDIFKIMEELLENISIDGDERKKSAKRVKDPSEMIEKGWMRGFSYKNA